ncbi:MAG TPA: hypothetical protein VGD14_16440 [bacterium]
MDMKGHLTIVAALSIGFGALGVFIAIIIFVAVVGGGILSGDPEAMTITAIVGTSVAGLIMFLSVPDIIAGIGLLKRKSWARVLALIIACIDLIFIPIGTIIGAYCIWVLVHDDTVKLFEKA